MQFEHKGIYSVLLNLDFGVKLPVSIIHVSLRLYSHLLVNNREWFVSLTYRRQLQNSTFFIYFFLRRYN